MWRLVLVTHKMITGCLLLLCTYNRDFSNRVRHLILGPCSNFFVVYCIILLFSSRSHCVWLCLWIADVLFEQGSTFFHEYLIFGGSFSLVKSQRWVVSVYGTKLTLTIECVIVYIGLDCEHASTIIYQKQYVVWQPRMSDTNILYDMCCSSISINHFRDSK